MPRPAKSLQQRLTDARRAGWRKFVRTAADEQAVLEGGTFDLAAGERVIEFCRSFLRHSKGKWAGQPFDPLSWQRESLLLPLYGWKLADGRRRFRRAYIEIPKKNGKSTLCSALTNYHLVGDHEMGAEVYSCAADRDQACIVYTEAANMAESSPELRGLPLKILRSTRVMLWEERRSKYEAISSDADSAEGKNASCIIADELHAWRGREFFESLVYAGRAREQPLFVMITTAGDDTAGICFEEHEKALRILRGDETTTNYFPLVYAAEPADDWTAAATWKKANPSLGETIRLDDFQADALDAQKSPRRAAAFKRYSLNIWAGAAEGWIDLDAWQACGEKFSPDDDDFDAGDWPCWAGVDLSRSRDLTAVVWVFFEPARKLYRFWPRLYLPEDLLAERERDDKVPYRAWRDAGHLRTTPGNRVDYGVIREELKRDAERFAPRAIGYDPSNAEHLCNQLLRLEDGLPMVEVRQTMQNMAGPTSELERLLADRRIRQPDNPLFTWMAQNVAVYEDSNGNIRPIKRKSRGRIDGIVAAILGLGRALAGEGEEAGSYYDDHDLEAF